MAIATLSTQCSDYVANDNDEPMNQSAESGPVVEQCRRSLYKCEHWHRLLMGMAVLPRVHSLTI
jgi:hypothetical protein